MSAPVQMLLAAASGIIPDPQNGSLLADNTVGNSAVASLSFGSDGSIAWTVSPFEGGSSLGDSAWYDPIVSGIGSSYWIRFTATSGTLSSNDASTFTSLSSARACSKSGLTGTSSCTVTVEIATDSGGTNIVYTMAGNTLAYQHTL